MRKPEREGLRHACTPRLLVQENDNARTFSDNGIWDQICQFLCLRAAVELEQLRAPHVRVMHLGEIKSVRNLIHTRPQIVR